MRMSTCSLAVLATALVIAAPRADAAPTSPSLSELAPAAGSFITHVQQGFSGQGGGGGYSAQENGGQRNGSMSRGGGGGGGQMGDQMGPRRGGNGSALQGGQGRGGAGGGQMGDQMGPRRGGNGSALQGGQGRRGGGGGIERSERRGGGAWQGGRGAGGGPMMRGERHGPVMRGERYGPRHYGPPRRGAGCGWLRQKALDTDSRYWWRRYRDCRASR